MYLLFKAEINDYAIVFGVRLLRFDLFLNP